MTPLAPKIERPVPAGGQTLRLPGSARAVSLHEQLYRYADDLHMMVERNDELQADNLELRASTDRLLESREELDAIVRTSLDIHLVTDSAGVILQANPASGNFAPLERLESTRLADWIAESHAATFLAMHENVLLGNTCPDEGYELHLRRADAARQPLIVVARVLSVRRGDNQRHLHWILRDITYLRETEFETQVASMVFKNAAEGVMITDIEGDILAVNAAFSAITGFSAEEALGRSARFLSSGHHGPEFYEMFWQSLRTTGSWQGMLFNRRKNGETYPERLTVNAVRDTEGRVLSYIAVFADLTQPAKTGDAERMPYRDALTQLANHQLLGDRLERQILLARRTEARFSVIRIDIDGFAAINSAHGFFTGDRVLREVASRLAATVRESDTLARVGPDEFVLLAPGLGDPENARRFCTKLLDSLHAPALIDDHVISLSASLGCALFPDHGTAAVDLLTHSAQALDRARADHAGFAICGTGELAGPPP